MDLKIEHKCNETLKTPKSLVTGNGFQCLAIIWPASHHEDTNLCRLILHFFKFFFNSKVIRKNLKK